MQVVINTRLGFGFDFQYEEELCYRIGIVYEDGTEDEDIVGFVGNILRLPFLVIFIGEFRSMTEVEDDPNQDNQQDAPKGPSQSEGDGKS